ncbi:Hypothetical predicted protein [Paramuricea clavata]|uniref:Furin, partial n=1 Tax=Paramuricea clavata TaxID=317549 RepID=A0A7D9E0C4_PARCT|nr:Hypothetical predicted protein [Paramuricea clavata]
MAELLLTNKGKLRWRGEFESLQIFLEKDLNIRGKWISASGAKLLKTEDIQIRWYSQQETITLNGPKAEEYKSLLKAKGSVLDITETTESVDKEMSEASQQEVSVSEALNITSFDPCLYKTVEAMKSEINALKSQFNKHCLDSSKLHIESKIQKDNNSSDARTLDVERLENENENLKQENQLFRSKIDYQEQDLLHLNNKLKTLEDERASLITVIRLLYSDRDENNKSYSQCEYQSVMRGSTKANYPRSRVPNAASKQNKIPDVVGKNNYSPLEVEQASEDDEEAGQPKQTSKSTTRVSKKTEKEARQQHQQGNEKDLTDRHNSNQNQRKVDICGDSMTKYIQAHKLGRSTNDRVTSKSFSGAKCKDMKHYIMPTLEKKPDEIILHVGTNDLKTSSAKTVVKDIMALKDFVVKTSPRTKVTISELIVRTDDETLNNKIKQINTLLKQNCAADNTPLIEHSDVNNDCLNQSGVHLNNKGTALFALSIINHIRHF